MDKIFSTLIPTASISQREAIAYVLRAMPRGVIETLAEANCTIRPLAPGERYDEASKALKRLSIDCDGWPCPSAGLVVVEERAMYVRSRSAMTIAHETRHLLDLSLGGGIYRSTSSASSMKSHRATPLARRLRWCCDEAISLRVAPVGVLIVKSDRPH